jgi:hypothetical protein
VLTLNQIVSQITNLATAHEQIAESGVGDFAEWQAKERSYPILWVFHESTAVSQMEISFSIRLICADRVIVGEEGDDTQGHEQEVISDTLLVLLDFLAYFQQNHSQPYDVVTSATIDPFTERLNDRLAGNSVTIQIRQPFDWNKCQIPQTGAAIPPTVDGLTLYNFCDPSVIARLTDEQVACLIAQYNEPCEDATITINSAPFASVVSGGALNVPVIQNGSPVGAKVGSNWVIPPCADGTVNITNTDADPIATVTVASGGVEPYVIPNVSWTNSDGSAESTPYGDAIVCDMAGPSGGVTVAVSNANPDVGDTITITATPTGFTPTSYQFILFNGSITLLAQQAGNTLNWTVNSPQGSYDVYVLATDGTVNAYGSTPITTTGDPDAYAFLAATGITDPTIEGAIVYLVTDLKSNGLWSLLNAIYPMVGGTAATHKYNLKNPLDTDAAFRLAFFGGWTHSSTGAQGNGANAYANTFITPSVHLLQNNVSIGVYSGTASPSNVAIGSNNATPMYLRLWPSNSGFTFPDLNDGSLSSVSNTNSSGFIFGSRVSATAEIISIRGVLSNRTESTNGINAFSLYLNASNSSGVAVNFSTYQLQFAFVGQGMNSTQCGNLHTVVQQFQTLLGRQV